MRLLNSAAVVVYMVPKHEIIWDHNFGQRCYLGDRKVTVLKIVMLSSRMPKLI